MVDTKISDLTSASDLVGATVPIVQSATNKKADIALFDAKYQPLDASLTAYAALVTAADKAVYYSGADVPVTYDISAYGRTLAGLADETALEALIDTLPSLTSIQSRTVTLADAGADALFGWDDSASAYQNLSAADARTALAMTANGQSLVTAANYAAMRGLLDLEAGTDFYSIAAADAAFQPLDADLTAIAALTTTAAGRSGLTIADPNADRVVAWDDSAASLVAIALADILTEAAPASGDYLLVYGAEGDLRKVDWASLPGAGGGLSNAYVAVTDGTTTAGASGGDTFKLRTGTGVTVTVGSNDVTHGDNALIELDADLASWAGVTRASGFDTFAATPSSVNLASLVTGETGSGALMFGTSPSITTDITIPNTGLHLLDTDASHDLIVKPGSNLSADRTLTVTTGDTNIEIDLTDPGADRLMFWDDSASKWIPLTLGTNLTITGTTLDAAGGSFTAASQAEQEAASSNTVGVTPLNQHFHPSAAKVWCSAGATGNILSSYNMTSVTDTGTGDITFTFATDFSSANYSPVLTLYSAAVRIAQFSSTGTGKTAGAIGAKSYDTSSAAADPTQWQLAAFGDQ